MSRHRHTHHHHHHHDGDSWASVKFWFWVAAIGIIVVGLARLLKIVMIVVGVIVAAVVVVGLPLMVLHFGAKFIRKRFGLSPEADEMKLLPSPALRLEYQANNRGEDDPNTLGDGTP